MTRPMPRRRSDEREDRGEASDRRAQLVADWSRLAPRLERLARAVCAGRDAGDVEDLMQSALLRYLEAAPDLEADAQRLAWFRTTMMRLWIDRRRAVRRRLARAARRAIEGRRASSPPTDALEQRDQLERVRSAMDELPDALRAVLALRLVEDLPIDAIARTLSITPEAARVRLHRARARLRAALGEEDSS